jgi:hypothetical protein
VENLDAEMLREFTEKLFSVLMMKGILADVGSLEIIRSSGFDFSWIRTIVDLVAVIEATMHG